MITTTATRQGGGRKEEMLQCGTNTLMRTVKKTNNIELRGKVQLGEMGSKYHCVVKIGLEKYVQFVITSGRDLSTMITTTAAGQGRVRKAEIHQ